RGGGGTDRRRLRLAARLARGGRLLLRKPPSAGARCPRPPVFEGGVIPRGAGRLRGRRASMIITLSRQFMAGADKVAQRLAEALGWTVVDDAFIEALAERSGYDPEDVRGLDERVPTFMERFAQSSAL